MDSEKFREGLVVRIIRYSLIVLAFVGCALHARAQSGTKVTGVVEDQSGAVVAGMELTIINQTTGEMRRASTESNGNFSFENVPSGSYLLKGDMEDFQSVNLPLTVQQSPIQLKVVLKILREEEVTVTTQPEPIDPGP